MPHWQLVMPEAAFAEHLDLVGAGFWNFPVPLRNCLCRYVERAGETRDPTKVLDDFFEGVHPLSVNALTTYVKHDYSHEVSVPRKLRYVATKKKRELDPRAVARGKAIREARKARNLSQEELARAIGVGSREAVSHWEKGTVGEIDRAYRQGLCKTLGFEEAELLLDADEAQKEFEMPLSREAKSIAYRWDDLPDKVRAHLRNQIAEIERLLREQPEVARRLYPEIDIPPPAKK